MNKTDCGILIHEHSVRHLIPAAACFFFLFASPVRSQETPPVIGGLEYVSSMQPVYAEEFEIYYYDDDYEVIDVKESGMYLLVPENGAVPEELPEGMTVIRKPVENIYLAASSAMSLFRALDSLDRISFSGIKADGWYVEEAKKAMEEGQILFAGKYSQPDYELLVGSGCGLAVESTMILHSPKVPEMFRLIGIPVFTDYSSYEDHPLARTEWIRLYGCLLDEEEAADAFFKSQEALISEMEDFEKTGSTVAFFSINSSGAAVIRSGSDYIPKMIEMGGGAYLFPDAGKDESSRASLTISMEEFYAAAVDADYLIYNGTIEKPIGSLEELYDLNPLFRDFKAVREDHVYVAGKSLYQASDIVGNLILDIHSMLTGEDEETMTFLKKIS